MRFSEYMERCLYGEDGFYSSGRGIAGGRGGDFITSPEIGPLFGAVLARALDGWWIEAGRPSDFPVVDLGSGPGGLSRALEFAAPECAETWTLTGVDRAAGTEMPELAGAVVIANELLDNIPFDIAMRTEAGDHVMTVAEPVSGGTWDDAIGWEAVGTLPVAVPNDQPFPVFDRAANLLRDVLARSPLRVVAFDYGVATTAELATRGGWLRTYRSHERGTDPFADPGERDITTDLAVDQLPTPSVCRTQADFLRDHGIEELVDEGRAYWHSHAGVGDLAALRMRSRVREAEALLDADGVGGFLCLEWSGDSVGDVPE